VEIEMDYNREQVMSEMLELLSQLADDWEYSGDITPDTDLFADMGLASLDVVVLAMSVQQHYERVLPFADLFADMGQRGIKDLSVKDWVDFIHTHLPSAASVTPAEGAAGRGAYP
jgi:acyl carrier protein